MPKFTKENNPKGWPRFYWATLDPTQVNNGFKFISKNNGQSNSQCLTYDLQDMKHLKAKLISRKELKIKLGDNFPKNW